MPPIALPSPDDILGASTLLAPQLKAAGAGSVLFSGYGGGRGGWGPSWNWAGGSVIAGTLPGGERNYSLDVGDLWLNPVIGAGIGWIGQNFGEPEGQVQTRQRDGLYKATDDHDLVRRLDEPNGEYDADSLWFATALSYLISDRGAFWIKAKAKSGRVLDLWYAPHWEIEPHWGNDGRTFIDGYYHVIDGKRYPLEKEDVVHFRRGLNPADVRGSLPSLAPVLAEVATDNAATLYSAAILRNMGMPGLLITPASREDEIDADEQETIKRLVTERTTGENRGKPLVNSVPLKVERLSMSPEDLALDRLRNVPEGRICAALGLSPMVLNLPSAATFATFANYEQAVKAAYLGCLIPLQKSLAKAITRQLLPDFGGVPGRDYFEWNYAGVKALAEDQDKIAARVALLFEKRLIKRGKACEMIGVDLPGPEDDVYSGDTSPQIFGYHLESGMVDRTDVRKSLGLPADPEAAAVESNRLRDVTQRLAVAKAAKDAGIPLEDAVKLAGLEGEVEAGPGLTPKISPGPGDGQPTDAGKGDDRIAALLVANGRPVDLLPVGSNSTPSADAKVAAREAKLLDLAERVLTRAGADLDDDLDDDFDVPSPSKAAGNACHAGDGRFCSGSGGGGGKDPAGPGSPPAFDRLSSGVARTVAEEGNPSGVEVRVEQGPPRNAKERKFAERAIAQGKTPIAVDNAPKVREEQDGDVTRIVVGARPYTGVRPLTQEDRERTRYDEGDQWAAVQHNVRRDVRSGEYSVIGEDVNSSHRTRDAALREARKDAEVGAAEQARDASKLIAVRRPEKHNYTDDLGVGDPGWTTTFRLIESGGDGKADKKDAGEGPSTLDVSTEEPPPCDHPTPDPA